MGFYSPFSHWVIIMNIITEMHDWSKKPYQSDMSALHWALFIGLLMVAVILWRQVIHFIIE